MRRALWLMLTAAGLAGAHPMGNFSVNHYARLRFGAEGVRLTYVLDLAEIPAFELFSQWGFEGTDQAALESNARPQAKRWLANLSLTQSGREAQWKLVSISAKASDGAAGMQTLRVVVTADAELSAAAVQYEDRNYPGRAGWKEVVVEHDGEARIAKSSQPSKDLSAELTRYPADPALTPPQDLTARVIWAPVTIAPTTSAPSVVSQPAPAAAAAPATFTAQQPKAAGTVVAGDYLSRLLKRKEIGWDLMLLGLLAAFGLGAAHAMSPGHGKTIVAAYLVGSRGTLRHAGLLGCVVTFTHTFTVFLLGLGVLFFQQYVIPEKIVPALGAISGLSIVAVGLLLLYRRAEALLHDHEHGHGHPHHHGDGHVHTHDGHTHSHALPEKVTLGSLVALGVSGGLVPCPSALILMLSAIALGRPALGLMLLLGFSAGLAAVLMGIGMLAVYAKHLLPASEGAMRRPLFRLIPIFSAVVVICLGVAMTAVSAGWVRPLGFLS